MIVDETQFTRKDTGTEQLIPVAEYDAAVRHGWSLSSAARHPVPSLSYDPSSFPGTVVDQTIAQQKLNLDIRYMDALVETLKRRTLAGGGIAWLPEFAIQEELASGRLVRMGPARLEATLTLSLFCSPGKLDDTGRMVWESF